MEQARARIYLTDGDRDLLVTLVHRGESTVEELRAALGVQSTVWLCGRLHRLAGAGLVANGSRGRGVRVATDVAIADSGWVGVVTPLAAAG